jgi:acetyl-CoA carboxylase carboxyl transferase subunit alpha
MTTWMEFERPVLEIEQRIAELEAQGAERDPAGERELAELRGKAEALRREIYANLAPYQRVQLAKHPRRPYTLDYVERCLEGWIELHGDRHFGDDPAIVGGMGFLDGRTVMLIGHQKGRDTKENLYRRFGMANPEGYRKALRLMKLAERFRIPIVTLLDTPGAYPGLGGEERGQAEAIAVNLREMARLEVPIVTVVIGEGGSGGALGLAVSDAVYMLENAVYSVISPEGCAAILWRDGKKAPLAAEALKLTAVDLDRLGVIDGVIPEPLGGAQRDPAAVAAALKEVLLREITRLSAMTPGERRAARLQKFRRMGVVQTGEA